jgi:NhaP-type Na+/H+ or K+/H+ antiporter
MPNRIAGILALISFAMCLLVGGFEAGNPFSTVVLRSLTAMAGTYVIGYLIGLAAERMLGEQKAAVEKAATAKESTTDGR